MDNIGSVSGLVVTWFRQSRGWESHSPPVGTGRDRVDIQPGHWASCNLGALLQKSEIILDTVSTGSGSDLY